MPSKVKPPEGKRKIIWSVFDGSTLLSKVTGAVGIGLLFIIVTVEVIMRYTFKTSLMLADEVGAYLLVMLSFMGLAYTLRAGSHIKVEVVTSLLRPKVREWLKLPIGLCGLVASCILLYHGYFLWNESYELGIVSGTVLAVPMWIPHLFIPFGFLLLALEITVEAVEDVMNLAKARRHG